MCVPCVHSGLRSTSVLCIEFSFASSIHRPEDTNPLHIYLVITVIKNDLKRYSEGLLVVHFAFTVLPCYNRAHCTVICGLTVVGCLPTVSMADRRLRSNPRKFDFILKLAADVLYFHHNCWFLIEIRCMEVTSASPILPHKGSYCYSCHPILQFSHLAVHASQPLHNWEKLIIM